MKVEGTEVIDMAPPRVFEVFSDIEKAAERIDGIAKVEILSTVRHGMGLRWRETRVMFGKEATEEMEFIGFDEPAEYVVEAESHGTHYLSTYSFEELGPGQTKVTWTFEGTPKSFFAKLMSPLAWAFKGTVAKMLRKDVLELKRFIEDSP